MDCWLARARERGSTRSFKFAASRRRAEILATSPASADRRDPTAHQQSILARRAPVIARAPSIASEASGLIKPDRGCIAGRNFKVKPRCPCPARLRNTRIEEFGADPLPARDRITCDGQK